MFKALTIPGLRDKEDVERLLDLYHDSGEEEKYKALEKRLTIQIIIIRKKRKHLFQYH